MYSKDRQKALRCVVEEIATCMVNQIYRERDAIV
jgi:hypothetical protein